MQYGWLTILHPVRIEDEIIRGSLEEVKSLFHWAEAKNKNGSSMRLILIGGWAVDVYNSWYGSRDIDIMVNSRALSSVQNFLYMDRGFHKERDVTGQNIYCKTIAEEKTYIDFVKKRQEFQGTGDTVDYRFLNDHVEQMYLRGSIPVIVPDKASLLKMKIKAAWDRKSMLKDGNYYNEAYLRSKVIKDFGDIVALLDRRFDNDSILDLKSISMELSATPYIRILLDELLDESSDQIQYRDYDEHGFTGLITNFLSIV